MPPPPDNLQVSSICEACKSIFNGSTPKNENGEVDHHGLDALAARATRGCHLCLTVYMSIEPEAYKSSRISATGQPVDTFGFASVSPIARDQARLKFRYVKNEVHQSHPNCHLDGARSPPPPEVEGKGKEREGDVVTPAPSAMSANSADSEGGKAPVMVELILMNPKYAVEPGVRNINMESISTGSSHSFEVARQWIDECSFNHMKCSVNDGENTWKPTYLLDVSLKGAKGAQGVKLVNGMFLDPLTEYLTLSHCWGKSKATRLHKGTLKPLRQGVAASSLPKTFAEAAMVTDRLGFRYLWIDALCIMHDSEQDALQEISQMSRIYAEATLNLAATSSRDDASGLIYSRDVMALNPSVIHAQDVGIENGYYKVLRSTIWHDLVDASPLSQRAWAFQERCLAKRTLHFTRNELLWECQQMCCSEVFPKGLPATMGAPAVQEEVEYFNKRIHHQRHGNWHLLVKMYCRGRLTYSSDKLLAVSGLAKQYMTRNRLRETDYLCGLWSPQLPLALLWRVDGGRRPKKYRAPSWTWASTEGEIVYPENAQNSKETCLEVISADMTYKADRFGQVENGKLKVRGFMARGLLRRTHDYWGHTSCVIQCPQAQLEIESAWFDDRLPKLSDVQGNMTEMVEVYLLPVIDIVDRVEGLILCSNIKRGEFRRIGAFEVSRYDQINWDRFRGVMKGDKDMTNYEERLDHTNGYWFASDYTYTINLV
jgi:Heterokaryon incompatibility protein (HET)